MSCRPPFSLLLFTQACRRGCILRSPHGSGPTPMSARGSDPLPSGIIPASSTHSSYSVEFANSSSSTILRPSIISKVKRTMPLSFPCTRSRWTPHRSRRELLRTFPCCSRDPVPTRGWLRFLPWVLARSLSAIAPFLNNMILPLRGSMYSTRGGDPYSPERVEG